MLRLGCLLPYMLSIVGVARERRSQAPPEGAGLCRVGGVKPDYKRRQSQCCGFSPFTFLWPPNLPPRLTATAILASESTTSPWLTMPGNVLYPDRRPSSPEGIDKPTSEHDPHTCARERLRKRRRSASPALEAKWNDSYTAASRKGDQLEEDHFIKVIPGRTYDNKAFALKR